MVVITCFYCRIVINEFAFQFNNVFTYKDLVFHGDCRLKGKSGDEPLGEPLQLPIEEEQGFGSS